MAEVKKQKTEEKLIITDEFIAKHKENPNVQVQMEKSKVEITDLTIYHEEWVPLLLLALALLALEFLFTHIILKRIP